MKICSCFDYSIYSIIFFILELISIIILFIFYLKNILNIWKYSNHSYDKIEIILIYLAEIQLVLFILRLFLDYNIFSVLISINKFSQNLMICSLLMIIILGKYSNSKNKIINYFLITLLIADILLFLIGIKDNESFKKSETESIIHLFIAIFCGIINIIIIYKSYVFKKESNEKINNNLNKNKLISLKPITNDGENPDYELNNENDFFNTILNQHLSNALTILSVYFYILIPFLISYFMEIIIYFFFNSNIYNINNDENIDNNNTIYNNTNINNTDYNNSYYLVFIEENNNNYSCAFNFGKLVKCFVFFILRDFLPYFVSYLMFFYYKEKYHRRLSF